MKTRTRSFFSRLRERSRRYFTRYGDEVTRNNLSILRWAILASAVLLLAYGLLIYLVFYNRLLITLYLAFGALVLGFLLFSLLYGGKKGPNPRVVQGACLLFMLLPLAFTACINVLPYPDHPSVFFPMVHALVSVLFLIPLTHTALLLTLADVGYIAFVLAMETPVAAVQDVVSTVTAWILGLCFSALVMDLRLREGERRMELERLSATDALTGLPNRRWVETELPAAYRRCRCSAIPVSAFMLDVDDFKAYNDRFGHLTGDACLSSLGEVLRGYAAELGGYAARYGGEEFLFLLPGCGAREAEGHAEELLRRIRAISLSLPGGCDRLTASLGAVTESPPPGDGDCRDLLRKADAALYRAKSLGKDRTYFHREASGGTGAENGVPLS